MRRRCQFFFLWVFGLATLLVVVPGAYAQMGSAGDKVDWSTRVEPAAVQPGGSVTVHLTGALQDGWKMYALDSPPPSRGVNVSMDSMAASLSTNGPVQQADPKRGYDPNFEKEMTYFEETAALRIPVSVAPSAKEGAHRLTGTVTFMVCSATLCLPPTPESFAATVDVSNAAESAGASSSDPREASVEASSTGGMFSGTQADGLFGFLLLAVGAGAAALLTPCVFPMIPLTVSYFTKHTDSRSESMRMALVYGVAIIGTFTGLGVAMALLVGAAGAQTIAANPWINLAIGAIFIFFALSLLGLFELRMPSGLVNYFNEQGNEQSGYLGVLFMGLTLTLVSFSCTAPFVGGLLAATAGGSWVLPVVGMVAFSTTFALPFIGFALFPKGLEGLPQSGSWMNAVKVTLGFVELAAALKFLSNADLIWGTNLLSRPLAIALTVVVFTLAGLYLLGKLRLKHEPAVDAIGSLRLLAAIAFFGVALYMLPGLFGASLGTLDAYLPPRQVSDMSLVSAIDSRAGSENSGSEFDWHTDDIDAAMQAGRDAGTPVFVDFTGYTCTNCRDMEANVFPQSAVASQLREDFVLLRLYTDDMPQGAEYQRYQLTKTGTTALPTYAILDPEDESVVRKVSGTLSVERFAQFLSEGAQAYQQRQPVATR